VIKSRTQQVLTNDLRIEQAQMKIYGRSIPVYHALQDIKTGWTIHVRIDKVTACTTVRFPIEVTILTKKNKKFWKELICLLSLYYLKMSFALKPAFAPT
jgi:hypothetical protein